MQTHRLFASGLGLLFSCPRALRRLEEGNRYTLEDSVLLSQLLGEQSMFLLATGSPELDYVINVYETAIPSEVERTCRAYIDAGLNVTGGAIVVRDGYDLLEWVPDDESAIRVPVDDGYYRLRIGWTRSQQDCEMILQCVAVKASERVLGDGTYELIFEAHS